MSNDRFTAIKYDMLYVGYEVRLSRAGNYTYSLTLRYDCAISVVSQALIERMKKKLISPRLGIWEGFIMPHNWQ